MIQSGFEYSMSNKHYEFGGGCKTHSLGKVTLPIYVIDKDMNPHLLHVWIEVLNQPRLPLLLGTKSLTKVKGTLCFGNHTLTIDWGNKRLCLPINQEKSGHFHLQFFPMAQAEENYLIREAVYRAKWTKEETQRIVTYIAREKNPRVEKIKEPKKLKMQKIKEPLTRKQIIHLHQALGHAQNQEHGEKDKNVG